MDQETCDFPTCYPELTAADNRHRSLDQLAVWYVRQLGRHFKHDEYDNIFRAGSV